MTRSVRRLTSRDAVLHALALYDELGSDAFLGRYGFGRSYRYQLVHDGRDYDSKVVAGVAFGFQYPSLGPLRSDEFSGGNSGAAHVLRRLGFDIRSTDTEPSAGPPGTGVAVAGSPATEELPPFTNGAAGVGTAPRIFLVGCVKTKSAAPSPARDLYSSDLFKKRRAYVESVGGRWFVLSAQHGLVAPGDVLEPYDMALKDQPAAYRDRWGRAVVKALVERLGPLNELDFEVHAGAAYADALRQPPCNERPGCRHGPRRSRKST